MLTLTGDTKAWRVYSHTTDGYFIIDTAAAQNLLTLDDQGNLTCHATNSTGYFYNLSLNGTFTGQLVQAATAFTPAGSVFSSCTLCGQTVTGNPAYSGTVHVWEFGGQGVIIDGCLNVSGISMNSSMTGFSGLCLDNSDGKGGFIQWGKTLSTTARLAQVAISGQSLPVLAVQAYVGSGGKFGVWDLGCLDTSLLFVDPIVASTGLSSSPYTDPPNNIVYFFSDVALWGPSSGHKLYDASNSAGSNGQFLQINSSGYPAWSSYSANSWNGGTVTNDIIINASGFGGLLQMKNTNASGLQWGFGIGDSGLATNQILLYYNNVGYTNGVGGGSGYCGFGLQVLNPNTSGTTLKVFTTTANSTIRNVLDDGSGNVSTAGNLMTIGGSDQVCLGKYASLGIVDFGYNWNAPIDSYITYANRSQIIRFDTRNSTGAGLTNYGQDCSWLYREGGLSPVATLMRLECNGNLSLAGAITLAGVTTLQSTLGVYGLASFAVGVNIGGQLTFQTSSSNNAYLVWSNNFVLTVGASGKWGSNAFYGTNAAGNYTGYFGAMDIGAVFTQYINPIGSTTQITVGGNISIAGSPNNMPAIHFNAWGSSGVATWGGNIGIGLDNVNNMVFNGVGFQFANAGTLIIGITSSGNISTGGSMTIGGLGSGSRALYITNASGGGTIATYSSSRRYKENIEDLTDCSWIYQLKPVLFDWKDPERKSEGRQHGLIAEDVFKVRPDFVWYNVQGEPDAVKYEHLATPLLVEIKKLRRELTELQIKLKGGD